MIFKQNGDTTRLPMSERDIYKVFSNMDLNDIQLLGLNKDLFHPRLRLRLRSALFDKSGNINSNINK